jgi:TPR repeat protein
MRALLLGAGLLIATNSSRAESEAAALDRAKAAHTRRDFATAVSIYHELDAQGSVEGTRFLGVMYLAGVGVEKDQKRVCGLFEAAMLRKDPLATQLVGDCYFNGGGVRGDYAKSAQLYRLAGERGVAQSYCALANQSARVLRSKRTKGKPWSSAARARTKDYLALKPIWVKCISWDRGLHAIRSNSRVCFGLRGSKGRPTHSCS